MGCQGSWCMSYSCSPTKIMRDIQVWGSWGGYMAQGTLMLMSGKVGGGGQGNGPRSMILGAFVAPSSHPSTPKKVCPLSLSCAISILIFLLPSCSMSTACLHRPPTPSFSSILPPHSPRAAHQSTTIPALAVVILVIVVMAHLAFSSSSCVEMVVDVESPGVLHTIEVCETHVWLRLAPISMCGVLGRSV